MITHKNPNHFLGVFDSGIGGLSVANAITAHLPQERLIYFGDSAHSPYGIQSLQTIKKYSQEITRFLLAHQCKSIVVACNTASAAAINDLRTSWPGVAFIGMEPAVKPAVHATKTGKIGVLATRGTINSERFFNLQNRFAQGIEVFTNPCIGLVELIESGHYNTSKTKDLLRGVILPMLKREVDTLVLGCTHYPFVISLIQQIAGESVQIIDPSPAVARQVGKVLKQKKLLAQTNPLPHQFYTSGDIEVFKRAAQQFFSHPEVLPIAYPLN